jgi:hypothetical protein
MKFAFVQPAKIMGALPHSHAPYASGDVDANTIVLWHCNENGGNDLIDDGFYQNNTGGL